MGKRRGIARLSTAMIAIGVGTAAVGQSAQHYRFDVGSQDLKFALRSVTREAGLQLFASADDLRGRRSPELHAEASVEDALQRLLAGTGLRAEVSGKAVFIRGRQEAGVSDTSADAAPEDIVVTGTRIRGAEIASRITTYNRDDIAFAGQADLGSFIRTLPANYSGGQNPGIIGGGDQGGQDDINGASELNLRGLGPDATLTLINGHRVAYDAQSQGIDIAAIPLAAIEKVEVVADGSSALYGSDAVSGVANVILRRDYDGVETSARIGGATDGGDFSRQFDVVTGNRWAEGGFMLAGDYNRNNSVDADERSITGSLDPSATLLPASHQYSAVLAGHQSLGSRVTFNLDAQFSDRSSDTSNPAFVDSDVRSDGIVSHSTVRSVSIAPSLVVDVGGDWRVTLQGVYGSSRTNVRSISYSVGEIFNRADVRYDNRLGSAELDAEGPIAHLPGGPIRLALGGGYRAFSLNGSAVTTITGETPSIDRFDQQQTVLYAYGEASVPIIGPDNSAPWMHDIHLTSAVRYEDYHRVAHIATPKLGIIVQPIPAITLKASWGRSFKAPTLYQQNEVRNGALLPGFIFSPGTPPAGSTVLLVAGGNPDLKPERATTWSSTISVRPDFAPRLTVEASYFHIRYSERVVSPITSVASALGNPDYAAFIERDPTGAQVEAVLASLGVFNNESGAPLDSSNVAAIVDESLRNAASQIIRGVDLSSDYRIDLGHHDQIRLSAAATYLQSHQQLSAAQPELPLAGTIFNPPHWRARGGAEYATGSWTFGGFFNHIGGLTDNRNVATLHVGSLDTVDMSVRYAPDQGPLAKMSATLSVENLFNAMPARIVNSNPADPPYDTTNYSSLGRFIAFTLTRHW